MAVASAVLIVAGIVIAEGSRASFTASEVVNKAWQPTAQRARARTRKTRW
jgi:hypothetical protein